MTTTSYIARDSNVLAQEIILHHLDKKFVTILDFGSGYGTFTQKLVSKKRKVYGCDIDKERIKIAKKHFKDITFDYVASDKKTPYKKDFFDCVILLGVLEHVGDEKETLAEVARILKPGGILYIYGINKGLLGSLDAANIKFLFPRLHKFLYVMFYGKEAYQLEFGDKQSGEMFGDFTSGKNWHSHYSKEDLDTLTNPYFTYSNHWLYGLFEPILRVVEFVFSTLMKRRVQFLWNLIVWDGHISAGHLSYSFVYKCKKK